ncbi:low molecular weight protein arginine phosphatase [Desulfolucanica intricata]|uniref:low molecular weight protein arginine phosphatase n=1 Tax=Desulfolucanica intricata TaxID=1285191 RepID=UPI00083232BE|nr:low molecular weight protein arginine phosphatase [Desulfolucanica intricata]
MTRKIILVCTGNTCRSSMAEALAKDILSAKRPECAVEISSAGVAAWPGSPASPQAVEALKEQGIDLSSHRAKGIDQEELEKADLVLTMTSSHRNYLIGQFPWAADKIYTLAGYLGSEKDVPDPFGQPVEVYRECAGTLREMLEAALDKFLETNQGKG